MSKAFKNFVEETKAKLLAYEMDMSCFDDYSDKEIELIKRLKEVLYEEKYDDNNYKLYHLENKKLKWEAEYDK